MHYVYSFSCMSVLINYASLYVSSHELFLFCFWESHISKWNNQLGDVSKKLDLERNTRCNNKGLVVIYKLITNRRLQSALYGPTLFIVKLSPSSSIDLADYKISLCSSTHNWAGSWFAPLMLIQRREIVHGLSNKKRPWVWVKQVGGRLLSGGRKLCRPCVRHFVYVDSEKKQTQYPGGRVPSLLCLRWKP